MGDTWYDEELLPMDVSGGFKFDDLADVTKGEERAACREGREACGITFPDEPHGAARAILRVDKPRWGPVDPAVLQVLQSGADSRFVLVRFSFQLDLPPALRDRGGLFTYARYSAHLWPKAEGEPQPTIYEVIPRDLYEGEARKVSVKLGPKVKLGPTDVGLGEFATDFTLGYIEPVVVGWPGENARAPYWELRPQSKSLIGTRYLWVIIELPEGSSGSQIASKLEGEVQTRYWKPIPLGPRVRDLTERPREVIG